MDVITLAPDASQAIEQLTYRYSMAMDTRLWHEMDKIFLPDAQIWMDDTLLPSREAGVRLIRACIECCSQTHHMNGNILVQAASSDRIQTISRFRAWHRGAGAKADDTLECMGTYEDEFRLTPHGWRIGVRKERSLIVIGDMEAFFSQALHHVASAAV